MVGQISMYNVQQVYRAGILRKKKNGHISAGVSRATQGPSSLESPIPTVHLHLGEERAALPDVGETQPS